MSGRVLILTDGKAGHENQSKAFARALGCEYDLREVHFRSKMAKVLSYFFDHLGIRTAKFFECEKGGDYAAVIGTGSGTFYAAKTLAAKMGVKCGVVLYPRGYSLSGFGCILAPAFDRPRKAANVIEIPANLVASDSAFYENGVKAFCERHQYNGGKAVAVIVGGPNKCSTMSADWMKTQFEKIFAAHKDDGAELWVTTSRRTPPEVEAVVDSFPWHYRLLYSRDHFNPIPAFVSLAEELHVTAESTGMLSEACTFGKAKVFALDNLNPGPHKFRRFVEMLAAEGYVGGSRKIDLSERFERAKRMILQ